MRKAFGIFLGLVVLVGGYLGPKWNSVSITTPDIIVHFQDGTTGRGDFSKTWDGDYVLKQPNGATVLFKSYRLIEIEGRRVDTSSAMLANWRAWVPAVLGVMLLAAYWIFLETTARWPRPSDLDR